MEVNLDTGDNGPKLWLNELMVTKSQGKREIQKRNYEKAATFFERILVNSDEIDSRILLSKCQQRMFDLHSANENQLYAKNNFSNTLDIIENEANLCFIFGEYEKSLMTYFNGIKKRKQPPVFTFGVIKAFEKMNESTNIGIDKYKISCLGKASLELTEQFMLNDLNSYKVKKDMQNLQIAKYLNDVLQLIIERQFKEAKQKVDLLNSYLEKIHCNSDSSQSVMSLIYKAFGVAYYLMYKDMRGWSEEENHQRILTMLGSTNHSNSITYEESFMGHHDPKPNVTKQQLLIRIKKSKSDVEHLYYYFELVRCYMRMGTNYLKECRNIAKHCYELAEYINSSTWTINSLVWMVLAECRLGHIYECYKKLNIAIDISKKLYDPGVPLFLEKMKSVISELEVERLNPNEKRQAEIVSFMPNLDMKMKAMYMFRQLATMPLDRQMSLVPGVTLTGAFFFELTWLFLVYIYMVQEQILSDKNQKVKWIGNKLNEIASNIPDDPTASAQPSSSEVTNKKTEHADDDTTEPEKNA
ncbi:uncharacterized protein LOC126842326 [Adelges cooleyi]|uniref:uncharacterized protein LOC126842326 n=1 Tax=Adelges cooleyi TaxID=133065 RepID=UPI0021809574|nr:uncharacterized protein LOC126842326 [Adelges cooleyi]